MITTIKELDDFFIARNKVGIKPGLNRMENLLEAVGHPEERLTAIHIAGTNGKGSTLTYLASALIEEGYNVGTFTSPSITTRKAMIKLNDKVITDQQYLHYFQTLESVIDRLDLDENPPSTFEIIVAITIQFFAASTDIAVIETGMGGKEDATNCFTPLLSIITSIGIDHSEFLGSSYQEIAAHKAGIIKQKTPVVIGDVPAEALAVITKIANDKQAPIYQLTKDFSAQEMHVATDGKERFTFHHDQVDLPITLTMKGKHQVANACLSIMSLLLLRKEKVTMTNESIQLGLEQAKIGARFEQISQDPLVIIDGAHNEASFDALIETIERYYPDQQKRLLFAAFRDKPIEQMIVKADRYFDHVVFTSFESPRAAEAKTLFDLSEHSNKSYQLDWRVTLDHITANDQECMTFIAGSLDFVGKVRNYFE